MAFPTGNPPSPNGQFPFHACAVPSPVHSTRLPLSPHCNPSNIQNDCLGVFHAGCRRFLASFADTVSREYRLCLWPQVSARDSSFPIVSTQGRLHCTQHANRTAMQVHLLSRTPSLSTGMCGGRTKTGLRGNRVVTVMPLMAARKP